MDLRIVDPHTTESGGSAVMIGGLRRACVVLRHVRARIEVVLSDNGRELWVCSDRDLYELFLQIEHRTMKLDPPLSTGVVESFNRALFEEHLRVESHCTWFETFDMMQPALDRYIVTYNRKRPRQGRGMNGRTPWQAFRDKLPSSTKTSKMTEQGDRKAA